MAEAEDVASARTFLGVAPEASAAEISRSYLRKIETVNRQIENAASTELRKKFLDQRLRLERALAVLLEDTSDPGTTDDDLPSDVPMPLTSSVPNDDTAEDPAEDQLFQRKRRKRLAGFAAATILVLLLMYGNGVHLAAYYMVTNPFCDVVDFCESHLEIAERLREDYESEPARFGAEDAEFWEEEAMELFEKGKYRSAASMYKLALNEVATVQRHTFDTFVGQKFVSTNSFCDEKDSKQTRRILLQTFDVAAGIIKGSYALNSDCGDRSSKAILVARQTRKRDFEGELSYRSVSVPITVELRFWKDDDSPALCVSRADRNFKNCYRTENF